MGLDIAVIGYNRKSSDMAIHFIARNEKTKIARLPHGSYRTSKGDIYRNVVGLSLYDLRGVRFDQAIIADDERWMVYDKQFELIGFIKGLLKQDSCVPEEFQVQEFKLFET